MKAELVKLRRKVDLLDEKIVGLLSERAKLSLEIGKVKSKRFMGIFAPDRERQVYERVSRANKGPVSQETLSAIYREIMSGSLSLEKPLKVAFLGPQATFTHLAAVKKFGSSVEYVEKDLISGVFDEVESEDADYGVVPVENSLEGAIDYTLDRLIDCGPSVRICSEIALEISHHLLSSTPLDKVKKVYSNPTVFEQCRRWLSENLPGCARVEFPTTSMSAAYVAAHPKGTAAIASDLAAKKYGLKILARSIEGRGIHNITKFLVIGRTEALPTKKDKTSIMFSLKDRVGALHDSLVPFKKFGINLTKIESRPSKRKPWEYYFFVDFIGHHKDKKAASAINELEKYCTSLKILGSYPAGDF